MSQTPSPSSLSARPRPRKACRPMATRICRRFSIAATTDFARPCWPKNRSSSFLARSFAGRTLPSLVELGPEARQSSRFAYLGDHSNSRGAADMGLFPDLLPGYVPVTSPGAFAEYPGLPAAPGKTLPKCLPRATRRTGRITHRWRQSDLPQARHRP